MALQTIESKDVTLGELFGGFFVVPNFQREYVWGTDEVRQLLEDIYAEFSASDRDPDSEYFIGTIVACLADEGIYQLIDGQQRMTTAYLVLCAIRDHIKHIEANEIEALKPQIAATSSDRKGKDVFRYRVALQYEDSCGVLEAIAAGQEPPSTRNGTRSVRNITNAYEVIRSFLEEHCKDEAAVRSFYAYFTRNVKLIRVKTISVTHALKIFETINARGLGLDSMDLLKNLIFMQTSMEEFDKLKVRWKRLVDILDKGREKPLRYLRYFIFARYDVDRLREDEIYDWFVKNEKKCGYKRKPFNFVDELIEAAEAYTRFVKGENTDGTSNRYLANIKAMSGAARQHLILLLAGRHLSDLLFTDLCSEIENLFFAYVITHENTRDFERKFAQWTKHLREVRDKGTLHEFLDQYFKPEKSGLAARFELAILQLKTDSLQQYRLRYVLAKLTQHVNEEAWGEGTEGDLSKFLESSVHVEHVLPQTADKKALAEFDRPEEADEYIGRLGNLALAEDTINESLGNRPFSKKRPVYTHSKFLLTRLLSGKVSVGKKTSVNRAIEGLPIFDDWSSDAIDTRQQSLTKLAMKVWEMPRPKRQTSSSEEAD
jgi:uncharacterized protein with ParB-like and HNH nuclease domain